MNYYAIEYECQDPQCKKREKVFISTEKGLVDFAMYKPFCCKACGHDEFYAVEWFDISQYAQVKAEEIASLQEANADLLAAAEVRSEELGKAWRGLEDMRQICNIPPSKYAEISQAQLVMIVGEMLKAIDETYKRYAPQWEAAEVETAE